MTDDSENKTLGLFCTVYKGKQFIKEYLNNLISQSIFKKVNFYILDCASPDGEHEILKDYLRFSNIKYRRLDEDPGLYAGWNICVDWCTEKYIGNWNVDDRKTPWSTEVLLNSLLADDSLDLVYGKTLITTKANDSLGSMFTNKERDAISGKREEVAQNMFNTNDEDSEEIQPELDLEVEDEEEVDTEEVEDETELETEEDEDTETE